MLYERRFGPFFVEPIVAGVDPVTFKPYICNMVGLLDMLNVTNMYSFIFIKGKFGFQFGRT